MRAQIAPSCVARVKSEWGFDGQDRVVLDRMPQLQRSRSPPAQLGETVRDGSLSNLGSLELRKLASVDVTEAGYVSAVCAQGRFDIGHERSFSRVARHHSDAINWTTQFTSSNHGRWISPLRRRTTPPCRRSMQPLSQSKR